MAGKDEILAGLAAWALAYVDPADAAGAKKAVPLLAAALKEPDARIRQQAVLALGEFGAAAKSAIPALKKAQSDADGPVRTAASAAIKKIGQ